MQLEPRTLNKHSQLGFWGHSRTQLHPGLSAEFSSQKAPRGQLAVPHVKQLPSSHSGLVEGSVASGVSVSSAAPTFEREGSTPPELGAAVEPAQAETWMASISTGPHAPVSRGRPALRLARSERSTAYSCSDLSSRVFSSRDNASRTERSAASEGGRAPARLSP